MHIDVAAAASLQFPDRFRQGTLQQLGRLPVERLQAGRGDIFRQRVKPVGKVSGFLRPRAGKNLIGCAPNSMAPLSASSSSLNLCISSFQVTSGSFSTSAMPSTLMNSVTITFLIAPFLLSGDGPRWSPASRLEISAELLN